MARSPENDLPSMLRDAHDEVLLALWAETDADETAHRKRADALMREAVQVISDHPQRSYDWSSLDPLL